MWLRVNRGAASEERMTLEMASAERLIEKSIVMSSRDLDVGICSTGLQRAHIRSRKEKHQVRRRGPPDFGHGEK